MSNGNSEHRPTQDLFKTAPIGLAIVRNRVFIQVNKKFCELFGYSKNELIGQSTQICYSDKAEFKRAGQIVYDQIRKTGEASLEARGRRRDGTVFDALISSALLEDGESETDITFAVLDISERRQAERKLQESENKFRSITENAADFIFIKDVSRRYTFINRAMQEMLEFPEKKILGKTPEEVFGPEQGQIVRELDDRTFFGETVNEIRSLVIGDKELFFNTLQTPLTIEGGRVTSIMGIVRDITKRIRTEEALRERERMLDALINAPIESAILVNTEGTVLAINRIGAKRLGKKEDEIIGMGIYNYFPSKLAKSRKAKCNQVIRTGKPIRFQDKLEGRYYDNNIYPVFDDKNKVTALAIYVRDVTRHRQAEIMLRSLVEGTAKATGRDFFNKLVEHLATALECKYSIIGRICETDSRQIKTLSFWEKNKLGKNFVFDLAGTPCDEVLGNKICIYKDKVSKQFPQNEWLTGHKIEAFAGAPLADANGELIGILTVMDTKPLSNFMVDGALSILTIFASRAAAELKRINAEDEQLAIATRLRKEQKALFDKHVALKQVLEHMDAEKSDFRHEISSSMEQALMPYVKKMRQKNGSLSKWDLELFEDAIKSITGTEIDDFRANYSKLTSREMDICDLIKEGKTSQEIADMLHLSLQTIQKHRSSIRKKLQLKNKNINLPAYLRYK